MDYWASNRDVDGLRVSVLGIRIGIVKQQSLIPSLAGGADFSECGLYRYNLTRTWDKSGPTFTYIGLNPSYANEEKNDNTTTRNLKRAIETGAGSYIAVNLFAFIATNPKNMKAAAEPVGPRNESAIIDAVQKSKWVLLGWGVHGVHRERNIEVIEMLRPYGRRLYYLEMTKDGHPKHPLYIRAKEDLKPFDVGPIA